MDAEVQAVDIKMLLMWADYVHNLAGNRGYGTYAVGAVGTPESYTLVVGINSSPPKNSQGIFTEKGNLFQEKAVAKKIQENTALENFQFAREPYHAEVSIVLYAKEQSQPVLAIASSRKVCGICNGFLNRFVDPNVPIVDGWKRGGVFLTHKQREAVCPNWTKDDVYAQTDAVRM